MFQVEDGFNSLPKRIAEKTTTNNYQIFEHAFNESVFILNLYIISYYKI